MDTAKAEKAIQEKLHPLEAEEILAQIITMASECGQEGCFYEIFDLLDKKGLISD